MKNFVALVKFVCLVCIIFSQQVCFASSLQYTENTSLRNKFCPADVANNVYLFDINNRLLLPKVRGRLVSALSSDLINNYWDLYQVAAIAATSSFVESCFDANFGHEKLSLDAYKFIEKLIKIRKIKYWWNGDWKVGDPNVDRMILAAILEYIFWKKVSGRDIPNDFIGEVRSIWENYVKDKLNGSNAAPVLFANQDAVDLLVMASGNFIFDKKLPIDILKKSAIRLINSSSDNGNFNYIGNYPEAPQYRGIINAIRILLKRDPSIYSMLNSKLVVGSYWNDVVVGFELVEYWSAPWFKQVWYKIPVSYLTVDRCLSGESNPTLVEDNWIKNGSVSSGDIGLVQVAAAICYSDMNNVAYTNKIVGNKNNKNQDLIRKSFGNVKIGYMYGRYLRISSFAGSFSKKINDRNENFSISSIRPTFGNEGKLCDLIGESVLTYLSVGDNTIKGSSTSKISARPVNMWDDGGRVCDAFDYNFTENWEISKYGAFGSFSSFGFNDMARCKKTNLRIDVVGANNYYITPSGIIVNNLVIDAKFNGLYASANVVKHGFGSREGFRINFSPSPVSCDHLREDAHEIGFDLSVNWFNYSN